MNEVVSLLNRRHIGLKVDSLALFFDCILKVDQLISESQFVDAIDELITIYPDQSNYTIGREVVGHDQGLHLMDHIVIQDFKPIQCYREKVAFSELENILARRDWYRLSLTPEKSCTLDFFS